MLNRRPLRLLAAAAVISGAALLPASAQQTPPPSPTSPPAATTPDPAPMPPASRPTAPAEKPALTPRPGDKSVTAPAKVNPLIGLSVFSSDGNKLGSVHSVNAESDGKVKAIRFKTGGFLGFGGKMVQIPDGKFTKSGENIQLGLTADEVSKLPEVKEQS
jgi:multidrug efflux pump subunit AcrA (membrane-fusion protein)